MTGPDRFFPRSRYHSDGGPPSLATRHSQHPGSPWENGYVESFNSKLRDELLNLEIFKMLLEVRLLMEYWRWEYNWIRPHSSSGYRPATPEAILAEKLFLGMAH